MKFIFILVVFSQLIFADSFGSIKQKLIKKGVSESYINEVFLLKEFSIKDEKTLSILHPSKFKYFDSSSTDNTREKDLKQHLISFKSTYDLAEQKYHVNREIIAALLMKESRLGHIDVEHSLLSSLSTIYLYFDSKNIRDLKLRIMAERSLVDVITFSYKHNYPVSYLKDIKSSYIGAIGYPQFMPFNLKYSISKDNSIPNLNNMDDAILSVANYMNKHGWKSLLDWRKAENIDSLNKSWLDYKSTHGWISFASVKEKSFLSNEYIKKFSLYLYSYNNSSEYVISILRTAYRLKGVN